MNVFNIRRAFETAKDRLWNKIYWAIDLHDTIVRINQENCDITKIDYFPLAKEVLQYLTKRRDFCLILNSSTKTKDLNKWLKLLQKDGIKFDYINCNPEIVGSDCSTANFSEKLYCNILLDDKAGFEGNTDWFNVAKELSIINEWHHVSWLLHSTYDTEYEITRCKDEFANNFVVRMYSEPIRFKVISYDELVKGNE